LTQSTGATKLFPSCEHQYDARCIAHVPYGNSVCVLCWDFKYKSKRKKDPFALNMLTIKHVPPIPEDDVNTQEEGRQ